MVIYRYAGGVTRSKVGPQLNGCEIAGFATTAEGDVPTHEELFRLCRGFGTFR